MGCKTSFVWTIVFAAVVTGYQPPIKTPIKCSKDSECESKIPFTICAENTAYTLGLCSCIRDYVLNQQGNNFECLEEAKLFDNPCQIDHQCKPKFGEEAACINNKCKCRPGAHFINLLCWKSSKLGEACGNPNNCVATEHSECSGICKCLSGFVGNPANTKCLKVARNIGDPCEDSVQCKPINPLATCEHSICYCPSNYIVQGNNCIKPPVSQPQSQTPGHNSVSCIKESLAMIAIALFLFCLKF